MTYPLLRQLSRPLILAVPQQFDDSSLIRSQTSDFLDNFADEQSALCEVAFGSGDTRFAREEGCFLAGERLLAYFKFGSRAHQVRRSCCDGAQFVVGD